MYSESSLIAAIVDCESCTKERKVYLLRVIMNAMGNAKQHKGLFFKFQAELILHIEVITTVWGRIPSETYFDVCFRRFRSRHGCFCIVIRMSCWRRSRSSLMRV